MLPQVAHPPQESKISIVCPCYNEAAGIPRAIANLKQCADSLAQPVEVLVVDDGSVDETISAALEAIGGDKRFRLISHKVNFGRGRALRTGIREATGDIIVTTEGDLSWGHDIIARMVAALERDRGMDAVFASTHAPGGGYQNVPRHRIWLSKAGNRLLHLLYTNKLSMLTGMTRAYRASVIQAQVLMEDDKEIHLEIAHRLLKLGRRIGEVPAILSWPDSGRSNRTNWGRIAKLMSTHLAFGIFRGLSRIIAPILLLLSLLILGFGTWAARNLLSGDQSIFLVQLTGVLLILWTTIFLGFFAVQHALQIEINVWKTQTMLCRLLARHGLRPEGEEYYHELPIAGGTTTPANRQRREGLAA